MIVPNSLASALEQLVESECALRVGMALRAATRHVASFWSALRELEPYVGKELQPSFNKLLDELAALDLASVAALDAHDSNVRYEHDLETMKMLSGIGVICVRSHEDTEPFAEALRKALDAHDAEVIEKFVASIRSSPEDMKRHDAEVERKALDEAEWWAQGHICENSRDCPGCLRIAELSRPAAESEADRG